MSATVTELRPRPAYAADNGVIRDCLGYPISTAVADLLLVEHLREAHEALTKGQHAAALSLVNRADQLLAARVAVTEFALGQSDQPTPPSAA